ncbi:glycosyltransferase [Pedobacter nototheniae]|uniref:glycosyltransferase n=1 Tax=Pedobacter nototheniae TaxID=2488994 RepID=UPI00103EE757|nr:glycosyltransferase [Pedobacter nototheniae]
MISVCITTYNGEGFIIKQLDSILMQLEQKDEIIISDDGSTDNTIRLIKSLEDSRIKILNHVPKPEKRYKFNLTTRNIENAILKAEGDIIILADQDDVWNQNRISVVKELLLVHDLVVNDCEIMDERGGVIAPSYFVKIKPTDSLFKNLISGRYLGCCMAFKRDCLKYALPFPKLPVPHDIWIGMVAKIFNNVYFTSEKLVKYRRHGANLSASSELSENSLLFKIEYRLMLLFSLVKRYLAIKFKLNESPTNR